MKVLNRRFLPVSTKTCHAATVECHEDSLVFAWFGGQREGMGDSTIYINYGDDPEGKDSLTIGERDNIPRWNPILLSAHGYLFIFVKMGGFCDRWQTLIYDIGDYRSSKRLKKPQFVPAGLNGPVKTRPIVSGDSIICGSSVETLWDWTSYIEEYTLMGGKFKFAAVSPPLVVKKVEYIVDSFWGKRQRKKHSLGIIQPALWKNSDGFINAFFRSSYGLDSLYYSFSYVGCDGWLPPKETQFKNPNSGIDVVYYDDHVYLVYNPTSESRFPLVLKKIKADEIEDGKFTVVDEICIQEKTEGVTHSTELSYPYMIEKDGVLHLVYTYGRSKIEYVEIGLE